ncbi:MAG TPA: CAP domain-containing protein, partial [Polyangiaceae bacterium]
ATACGATRASGENIAWNYRTPEDVMNGWIGSPGHDSNMRGNHTRVGIGYHLSSSREHWWGQLFGR